MHMPYILTCLLFYSYLKEWESKIQSVNNNKRFENDDDDDIQEVQVIHPVSGKDDSEQVSDKPQVTEKCALTYDSNVNKSVTLKKKSSPLKMPSNTCNKEFSASKDKNIINKAQKCDQIKTSEGRCGQKTRKQLFTANYMDLSDATDSTSEVLDQMREEEVKTVAQAVVSPKNLSLESLIELVKSKYCSPRKLPYDQQPSTSHSPKVCITYICFHQ